MPEAINIFNEASDEPAATFVNEREYLKMHSALMLACDRLAAYAGCPRFGFEGSDEERAECQKANEHYTAPPCSYVGCWYFELLDLEAMGHREAEG